MLVLVLERDCNDIGTQCCILIQGGLGVASQTDAVLCNGRQCAEFLGGSFTMLINSSNFIVEIDYGNVKDLLVGWLGSPPWDIAFTIHDGGLAINNFLDPRGQLGCCHAEAAYNYDIGSSSLEQVSEFVMVVAIDQVIEFDLFTESTHFIQKNKGDGVLLRISLSPRDSEDRGSVSKLCISSNERGNIDALEHCQLQKHMRSGVLPL